MNGARSFILILRIHQPRRGPRNRSSTRSLTTLAPEYLLRDRDSIYGSIFVQRVVGMGIKQKLISPRSPWQSPYVERLVGSIRRECLDRVIVFNERQLRRILESYFEYYHRVRPHRALAHDSPIPRPVESPDRGKVIEMPLVGGLHHQYLRQAA